MISCTVSFAYSQSMVWLSSTLLCPSEWQETQAKTIPALSRSVSFSCADLRLRDSAL
jgi:hypothetical protein